MKKRCPYQGDKLPQSKYIRWGHHGGDTHLLHARIKGGWSALCGATASVFNAGFTHTVIGHTWVDRSFFQERKHYIQHSACPDCLKLFAPTLKKVTRFRSETKRKFHQTEEYQQLCQELQSKLRRLQPDGVRRLLTKVDEILELEDKLVFFEYHE